MLKQQQWEVQPGCDPSRSKVKYTGAYLFFYLFVLLIRILHCIAQPPEGRGRSAWGGEWGKEKPRWTALLLTPTFQLYHRIRVNDERGRERGGEAWSRAVGPCCHQMLSVSTRSSREKDLCVREWWRAEHKHGLRLFHWCTTFFNLRTPVWYALGNGPPQCYIKASICHF